MLYNHIKLEAKKHKEKNKLMLLKQNTIYAAMDRTPSQQGRGACNFELFASASTVLPNIPNYARTMSLTGIPYHYFMKVIQQLVQTLHPLYISTYPPSTPQSMCLSTTSPVYQSSCKQIYLY